MERLGLGGNHGYDFRADSVVASTYWTGAALSNSAYWSSNSKGCKYGSTWFHSPRPEVVQILGCEQL